MTDGLPTAAAPTEEELGVDDLSTTEVLALRDQIIETASVFIDAAMGLIERLEHVEISPAFNTAAGETPDGASAPPSGAHPGGKLAPADLPRIVAASDFPPGSPLGSLDRLAVIDAIRARTRAHWPDAPRVGQAWLRGYLRRHGHPAQSMAAVPSEVLAGALGELEAISLAVGSSG